jgi:Secretion system C-terminal sorting domain
MRNLYILLLLLVGVGVFGQTNPGTDVKLSPGGLLENVFDRYGNKYSLSEITTGGDVTNNNSTAKSTLLCTSGIFELYFEAGSGMENTTDATQNARRAVVCQVFNDISNFINTPLKNVGNTNKVRILVKDISQITSVPNVLGVASGFYNIPFNTTAGFGGIVDNEVWKTIISGKDSYTNVVSPLTTVNTTPTASGIFYHGMMAFNFTGITWNTNLTINAPIGSYDLYTVMLHEITHALGFASLINNNGSSNLSTGFNYYSRYDRFLKNNANTQFLITNGTTNCSTMYNYGFNSLVPTSVLQPNTGSCIANQTTCSSAIQFVGTSTTPVYNPNCFDPASSLSHFEDLCVAPNVNDAYFVMSDASSNGVQANSVNTKRFLKPEERNALIDIGYSLNITYGNNTTVSGSFNNYGGTVNAGVNVAGINDGINSSGNYTFIGNSGASITINGILTNDTNATSFECLQDVYSPATLSATSGTSTTSITFSSTVTGLHLLRYVPINAAGKRGNITYIYVYVNFVSCATPNACNFVLNGNFEQYNTSASLVERACGWAKANNLTPDLLFPNNTQLSLNAYGTPCNRYGRESDRISPNVSYAGMVVVKNGLFAANNSEPIVTRLSSPLLPNTKYQLSFDVSLGEENSDTAMKFQAYLSNSLVVSSGSNDITVTNPSMLFTYPTFSTITNGWERIVFTFTTGATAGEQFLYLGGLQNVQTQPRNLPNVATGCSNPIGNQPGWMYYYLDNVSLIDLSGTSFNLPATACSNSVLPDLSIYLTATKPGGVFSGNGVSNVGTVYSFNASLASLGTNVITYTYTNSSGCIVQVSSVITVNPVNVTPTFSPVSICTGTVYSLPTVSNNGVSGTWTPAFNNTATGTYLFTPSGACNNPTVSLTAVVNPKVSPTFSARPAVCSGATIAPLPTTSNNGITGIWSPAINNTTTTTYTFTATSGQCVLGNVQMTIVVNANVTPTFNSIAPICSGAILSPLPTTSTNGIAGTWLPALNNTATTTYTFTPNGGQCATTTTLTITVLPATDPTCVANSCPANLTFSVIEPATIATTYQASNSITTNSNYTVNTGQDITMRAVNFIDFKTDSHLKSGSLFTAKIQACVLSKTINATVEQSSTEQSRENTILSIFPNPTDDLVTVAFSNSKMKQITVSSIEGKTVYSKNLNEDSYQLNIGNYQKGIYVLTIETIDGKIYREKLIKN